jgi:hypothetical protein
MPWVERTAHHPQSGFVMQGLSQAESLVTGTSDPSHRRCAKIKVACNVALCFLSSPPSDALSSSVKTNGPFEGRPQASQKI